MPALTEGRHPGEAIMSEGNGDISRENVTVAASQTIKANGLVARKAVATGIVATAAANAGNAAGSGVLTLADPAVSARVKDGVYNVTCIEPVSGGAKFEVTDPSGRQVGIATEGVAFDGEIKFTISDASDFAAGNGFTVTVEADAEDYQHVAFDPDNNDGSEVPVGMSIYPVATGSGETKAASVISRLATLNGNNIAWPDGITDAQKADAVQALAERNIIVR